MYISIVLFLIFIRQATEIMAVLYAKHEAGQTHCGLVTKPGGEVEVSDAVKFAILDIHMVKRWAIRFATDAACTVLRVDQVSDFQLYYPVLGFNARMQFWGNEMSLLGLWRVNFRR